jgi:hypothetical protein
MSPSRAAVRCPVCASRYAGLFLAGDALSLPRQHFRPECIKVSPAVLDFYDNLPIRCVALTIGAGTV